MKQSLARIFLFAALSMLWLHMVVPHVHSFKSHAGLEHELQEMDNTGFLSVLEKVFHVDLGTDHLSNFNKVRTLDLSNLVFLAALVLSLYLGWHLIRQSVSFHAQPVWVSQFYATDINSRPPPYLK